MFSLPPLQLPDYPAFIMPVRSRDSSHRAVYYELLDERDPAGAPERRRELERQRQRMREVFEPTPSPGAAGAIMAGNVQSDVAR